MREIFSGRRGRVAAGLLVAEFVTATQGLVIAAIMPRVALDFHALDSYALAFGAFFAAFLVVLPFAGPWADRYGMRRMMGLALALLSLGLALAAIAPSMPAFVAARFIEGSGDGMSYAVTFAIVARTYPDDLRPRVLSVMSSMWIVPALVGPGLGAFVATSFGWRWDFAGFLPLVGIAALLMLPAVDATRGERHGDAFAALRLVFSKATLQARRGLHASLVAYALLQAAILGADAYAALMLTAVRGLSLEAASFCITGAALGWSAAALAQPALLARSGTARLVVLGAVLGFFGIGGLLGVALGAPVWIAFVAWIGGGAGIGFAYPTITVVALSTAQEGREGVISSATVLAAMVGIVGGVSLCGIPVTLAARGATALAAAMPYTFAVALLLTIPLALLARRLPTRA